MPWTIDDVERHKKGLTEEQKKLWVKVANAERERCIVKGGDEKTCDAKAIKIANSVVDGVKEKEWMSEEYQRKIAENFYKQEREQMETLKFLVGKLKEVEQTDEASDLIERAEMILNSRVDFKTRMEMCDEIDDYLATVQEAAYKTENGIQFPKEAYAYVPDPEKPSTWKLRLWEDLEKKETPAQVGRAIAAFSPGGFRGQKVDIPPEDRDKVKAKIRAAWKKVNPDRDPSEMPAHIKESEQEHLFGTEDIVPLDEASVKQPNIPIKIIGPGWGSSGYYKKETLISAAPKYYKGLHMYWDHPTETEEKEQPERSLRNLAAVLVTDGTYKEDGIYGPGIYALCKPFSEFRPKIEEMAPYIGVSHRASGIKKLGEAEGRKGPIIEAITKVHSVDFVTVAGAGGQIVQLFESAKDGKALENYKTEEVKKMEMEKQVKELQESLAKEQETNKMLQEQLEESRKKLAEIVKQENINKVSAILKEKLDAVTDLPEVAKKRIKVEPILKEDGILDEEKVKEAIDKQIVDERNYLAEVSKKGTVEGMGDTNTSAKTKEQLKESLVSRYIKEGHPKEKAEAMAEVFLSKR